MTSKLVAGVHAAVLTPRLADNSVDVAALSALVRFLVEKGITALAINGATAEYPLTTPAHLATILTTVQWASEGRVEMLCGVGSPSVAQTLELAAIAQRAGVKALLLPMPGFFPYQQEDLDAFCRVVAAGTDLPILLYNLPQFTTGLEVATVRTLVAEVANIIGIKDSSGSLEILRGLTKHHPEACRIVGNDSALAPALLEGVCDGVVSGVACVLPEVIRNLYAQTPGSCAFEENSHRLNEFIAQLAPFPTPWGLKFAAETRGILTPTFAQPITAHRREQAGEMAAWLEQWLPTLTESSCPDWMETLVS